ncbi:MAG: hypothetical protein H6934_04600 [Burkholderiaceae bacterium]|nr:hypothetical protein [Burkholderiaceae bacterium]
MNHPNAVARLCAGVSMLAISGAAMAAAVLGKMPSNQSLKAGAVVFVENDGRCRSGEVMKVTGGSKRKDIARRIECVPRPD